MAGWLKGTDLQRLFNVELSRLACGINPAEIVDTIGEIGIFLNLTNDRAATNGMYGAGGDKICITGSNAMVNKKLFDSVALDASAKIFSTDRSFEAQKNFRAGPIGNDVPHFGFATAARGLLVLRRVGVVRMNLDGKFILGKNELHEHGELGSRRKPSATPVGRHLMPGVTQFQSGERAVPDTCFPSSKPRFANRLRQVCFVGEVRCERTRPPDSRAKDRFNLRWNRFQHGSGGGLGTREKSSEATQTLVNAFNRSGVRQPEKTWRSEGFAWHQRNVRFFEK